MKKGFFKLKKCITWPERYFDGYSVMDITESDGEYVGGIEPNEDPDKKLAEIAKKLGYEKWEFCGIEYDRDDPRYDEYDY